MRLAENYDFYAPDAQAPFAKILFSSFTPPQLLPIAIGMAGPTHAGMG